MPNTTKATPARKPRATKAKAATATTAPAATDDSAARATARGLARDAATIDNGAANFETSSNRDAAYLAFYGDAVRKYGRDTFTLAELHAIGTPGARGKATNPRYNGSAKATDAGAITRARKAGNVTVSDNGNRITVTAAGKATKAFAGKLA